MVGALQKREHQTIIMTGWYGEYFARQKRLKGLSHYLEPSKPVKPLATDEAMKAGPWLALMGEATT